MRLLRSVTKSASESISVEKTFLRCSGNNKSNDRTFSSLRAIAGFLLKSEKHDKVALCVYFQGEEATKIKNANSQKYENLQITAQTCANLYLKRDSEKKQAKIIKSGFDGIYTAARLLDETGKMLEKGGTQNTAKSLLKRISSYLESLSEKFKQNKISNFEKVFKNAKSKVDEICTQVVYLKDLRYLSCNLCSEYFRLYSSYSL